MTRAFIFYYVFYTKAWYICESKFHSESKFSARNFSSFFKLKFSTQNFWAEIPSWNFLSQNFQLGKWAEIFLSRNFLLGKGAKISSWNFRVENYESKISITSTKGAYIKYASRPWGRGLPKCHYGPATWYASHALLQYKVKFEEIYEGRLWNPQQTNAI